MYSKLHIISLLWMRSFWGSRLPGGDIDNASKAKPWNRGRGEMETTIKSLLDGHYWKIPRRPLHKTPGTEAWAQRSSPDMPQGSLQQRPGATTQRVGNTRNVKRPHPCQCSQDWRDKVTGIMAKHNRITDVLMYVSYRAQPHWMLPSQILFLL